jgi:hypothetical protein
MLQTWRTDAIDPERTLGYQEFACPAKNRESHEQLVPQEAMQLLISDRTHDHGSLSDRSVALLAQFPGPVTLHPTRLRKIMFFAFAAYGLAGTILYLWMLAFVSIKSFGFAFGFPVVFSALLVSSLAAISLARGFPRVSLDAEGYEIHYIFGVDRMYWSGVRQFRSFLFLTLYTDTRPPRGSWDRFGRTYLGNNHRAWTDSFGLGARNFARLMNAWRERALALQG